MGWCSDHSWTETNFFEAHLSNILQNMAVYAAHLAKTFPCGLSVCHFMNINSNSFARVGDYSILSKLIGQPK